MQRCGPKVQNEIRENRCPFTQAESVIDKHTVHCTSLLDSD